MLSVAIVDDDEVFCQQAKKILNAAGRFRCVAICESPNDALANLPRLRPAVVLLDIEFPGASGIEAVRPLKDLLPEAKILMLTKFEDVENIYAALKAGANGYLGKRDMDKLLTAVQAVSEDLFSMPAAIARKVGITFRGTDLLTAREREVLNLFAKGRFYKEVGVELGVSYDTVRSHVRRIYEKLHVHSRGEALKKSGLGP